MTRILTASCTSSEIGAITIDSDHAAAKRLLGYRKSFSSFRTANATLSGIETIRTIKRGHIHYKKPGVRGEIQLISEPVAIA